MKVQSEMLTWLVSLRARLRIWWRLRTIRKANGQRMRVMDCLSKGIKQRRQLEQETFLWILTHPHEVAPRTLKRAQNLASRQTIRQAECILATSS